MIYLTKMILVFILIDKVCKMKEFLCKLFGCDEPKVIIKEVYLDNPKGNDDVRLLSLNDAIKSLGFKYKFKQFEAEYAISNFYKNNLQINLAPWGNSLRINRKNVGLNIKYIEIILPNYNEECGYMKLKKIIEWAESIPDDMEQLLGVNG